jgi:hypothetical protein
MKADAYEEVVQKQNSPEKKTLQNESQSPSKENSET